MYQPCDIAVSESHSEEQGGGHIESSHPRASHQSQQRTDTHTHGAWAGGGAQARRRAAVAGQHMLLTVLLRCLQVAALKLALAQMMEANKTAMTEQASRVDAAAELSNQAQQDLALLASEHRSAQVALVKGLSDEVGSTATATATALEETRSSVTGWAATMLAGLDDSAQQVESFVSAQQAALASIVAQVRPGSRCFYVRVSDPCACVCRALMHVHTHTRRWRQTLEPARVRWQRIARPWMPLSVCVCMNTLLGACLHMHTHKHSP